MSNLRVQLVQRTLRQYRRPLLAALGRSPGIELCAWADLGRDAGGDASRSVPYATRHAPTLALGPFLWQSGSIRAVRSPGTDVAILGWNTRSLDLPFALGAARRRGVGTILWGHGFGKTNPRLGDRQRLRVAMRADALLLYGPTTRQRMIDLGVPPERVFMAPNAIDQTAIAAARRDWLARPGAIEEFRRRERLTGPLILFLSRLEADKDPILLVEAFARIRRARPDAVLAFIGDGAARREVESAVDRLGMRQGVRLVGETFDEQAIAPWAMAASCLVHPGGIGLSLMHAFGYGLPVVTTERLARHGPEVEILEERRNGLLFRDGDADDLATKVLGLLEDDASRRTMSDAAIATISGPRGRNIEGMLAGFLEAIRFAAAAHGRSRSDPPDRGARR